jgi:hypothetical protein
MVRAKQTPTRKHRKKTLPALSAAGVAGVSVAIAGGASATAAPAPVPLDSLFTHPPVVLGEEEIADVSLATFYVFDKENSVLPKAGEKLAWRCGGCGRCGHGCGRGCGRCGCGCGLVYCGGCGCGGCCISWGRCRWAC